MITIDGSLERITYYNTDNHYTVARLKTSTQQGYVTIVGIMPGISPGQTLKVTGTWETHRQYGQQLKIDSFEVTLPATVEGIQRYLASGIIKGIGPKTIQRIVRHFGANTLAIIENDPEKLAAIEGIGDVKAEMISAAWKEQHAIRDVMHLLVKNGLKASYSAALLKTYGEDAASIIRSDPFRIADDIPGDGFIIAERISRNQGAERNDPQRIRACIFYVLHQLSDDGHVFGYENDITHRCNENFGIDPANASEILEKLVHTGKLIKEADPYGQYEHGMAVYLKPLHHAETSIAARIQALQTIPISHLDITDDTISENVFQKLAIALSDQQRIILKELFDHKVAIITGGPGTGKTTLIRSIYAVLETFNRAILLAAPTGRAAKRLSEVTHKDAKTIHRLLGYSFNENVFEKNQDDPLDADVIIIDEASMVDTFLMDHLLKAVSMTSTLILVGDVFQLPSVGPGNVLNDLIQSDSVPVYYLTDIYRQAQESPIVVSAHKIRLGEPPELLSLDNPQDSFPEFCFIENKEPEGVVNTIIRLCLETLPDHFDFHPLQDVQILTPMHKGVVGTLNLNQVLQRSLNNTPMLVEGVLGGFKLGDKVMHLKNNYSKEIFNGDIGIVTQFHPRNKKIVVTYDKREISYAPDELHELSLAYAISVHKSQGSEYPAVIIPLMTQHYMLLQRNLLYTAITRGKHLVILIGTKKAFHIALKNDKPRQRLSGLAFRL